MRRRPHPRRPRREERGPRLRPPTPALLETPTGGDGDPAELPLRRRRLRRPTSMCDAHHLQPWCRDGSTTSPTAPCICGRHHTLVHHPDYTVERRPGWRISITRTPRTTPDANPHARTTRSHRHRTEDEDQQAHRSLTARCERAAGAHDRREGTSDAAGHGMAVTTISGRPRFACGDSPLSGWGDSSNGVAIIAPKSAGAVSVIGPAGVREPGCRVVGVTGTGRRLALPGSQVLGPVQVVAG